MIDSTFKNTNRLFVLSFKAGENDPKRNYLFKYYIPFVEIKEFTALIVNIPKTKLFRFLYPNKYYKLIGIDLSRQTNKTVPQQINFIGKLE